jgi:phage gp36-like protein
LDDVKAFLLSDYITAAEGLNNVIVNDTIEKVSGEIADLLSHRYNLTVKEIPQVIVNIAAVFSAYRIVEAITGIVSTEAAAENVWIPLQKEYQRMDRILNEIAKGTLKLTLPEVSGGKTVAVVNPVIELEGY